MSGLPLNSQWQAALQFQYVPIALLMELFIKLLITSLIN